MPHSKIDGFTLIEVLVALVIIAITISSLWIGLMHITRSFTGVTQKITSLWVANNVLIKSKNHLLGNKTHGVVKQGNNVWYWNIMTLSHHNGLTQLRVCIKQTSTSPSCSSIMYGEVA